MNSASGSLKHLRPSDVRALAQLATRATTSITDITEGVHQSVWSTLGVAGAERSGRTGGITGWVYKSVRGVTALAGLVVDTALAGLQPRRGSATEAKPGTPQREAFLAAINGVMGDRLVAENSPLTIPMTLRHRGEALNWNERSQLPEATDKVLLLIHGLCMNDLQWRAPDQERRPDQADTVGHGEALASALGYTPVFLRYNSGLHTSHNGRELSSLLEQLVQRWPRQIEELTIVAHSMGGLVARGALHHAGKSNSDWPNRLKNVVFLGTPHHGTPLEKAGNWLDIILASTSYTAPFTKLGRLRSAGITDLRYGNVVDEDWRGHDRFHRRNDSRQIVPLPEGVKCYSVAATTSARRGRLANRLIGDGLVPLRSALGEHDEPRRSLRFSQESQWIVYNTGHMQLLSSPEVTKQMLRWLTPPGSQNDDAR